MDLCPHQSTCNDYYSFEWSHKKEGNMSPIAKGEEVSFQEIKAGLRNGVPCEKQTTCLKLNPKKEKRMKLPGPIWGKDPYLPKFVEMLSGQRREKKVEMLQKYMALLRLRIRAKELYGCGRDAFPQKDRIRAYRKTASKLAHTIGLKLRREHGMLADWTKDPMIYHLAKSLSRASLHKKEEILKTYLYVFQLLIQGQRIHGQCHETLYTTSEIASLKEKIKDLELEMVILANHYCPEQNKCNGFHSDEKGKCFFWVRSKCYDRIQGKEK